MELNKKGSNGMVKPNLLIRDYDKYNNEEYLNISVRFRLDAGHARVAEWLTQSFDTRCPSGFVGSIPISSVTNNFNKNINKIDFRRK